MFRIRKLKPLASSIESCSHQFLQQCWVSGTAKGKAKIKAGQTLKRSKMSTKKGTIETSKIGGGGGKPYEKEDRLELLCLNAPTPVRYLKPKEREREAKREKLGLISKDRQRELDMMKKGKGKGKIGVSEQPIIIGTPDGLDLISLGLVDADKIPKYELTVEDGRRLAKEYSRVLMRRHRARQAAETTFLQLKKEAIEALPDDLKAAALVPDLAPFPTNRFMATLTPPIEGYIDKIKDATMKIGGKEKLR